MFLITVILIAYTISSKIPESGIFATFYDDKSCSVSNDDVWIPDNYCFQKDEIYFQKFDYNKEQNNIQLHINCTKGCSSCDTKDTVPLKSCLSKYKIIFHEFGPLSKKEKMDYFRHLYYGKDCDEKELQMISIVKSECLEMSMPHVSFRSMCNEKEIIQESYWYEEINCPGDPSYSKVIPMNCSDWVLPHISKRLFCTNEIS